MTTDDVKTKSPEQVIIDRGFRSGLTPHGIKRLMELRKAGRYNPRPVTDITTDILSMYITDNLNRSKRDLCCQIAYELNYDFEELYEYLKPYTLSYFKQRILKYGEKYYYLERWQPGNEEPYYDQYIKLKKELTI